MCSEIKNILTTIENYAQHPVLAISDECSIYKKVICLTEETGEISKAIYEHHNNDDVLEECSDAISVILQLMLFYSKNDHDKIIHSIGHSVEKLKNPKTY